NDGAACAIQRLQLHSVVPDVGGVDGDSADGFRRLVAVENRKTHHPKEASCIGSQRGRQLYHFVGNVAAQNVAVTAIMEQAIPLWRQCLGQRLAETLRTL